MRAIITFALFCVLYITVQAKTSSPKVQVYSHFPGEYGKENTLICHVSGFHPPDITIELLRNGEILPNTQQTDLAFEKGRQFHLTKSVSFTPERGLDYACKVRHMSNTNAYSWEPNM
uniref:Beta-2-microglobulin n=1 Tax=Labeobarbus intermedius TaxID=40831 RepID=B2MG_LABIN|nr:RecName: Full=Beta-2-microglobulin; Flags: Precursor [Labeobarbus intermedius]CAA90865.1 beta-2-microgobulin [Labeobarbus intermedius]